MVNVTEHNLKEALSELVKNSFPELQKEYAKFKPETDRFLKISEERKLTPKEFRDFIELRKDAARAAIAKFKDLSKDFSFPERYIPTQPYRIGEYIKEQHPHDAVNGWFPNVFILAGGQATPTHDHHDVVCASYTAKGNHVFEALYPTTSVVRFDRQIKQGVENPILNPNYIRGKPQGGVTEVGKDSRDDTHAVFNADPNIEKGYAVLVHFYDAYRINNGRIESILAGGEEKSNAVQKVYRHVGGIEPHGDRIESSCPTSLVLVSHYHEAKFCCNAHSLRM